MLPRPRPAVGPFPGHLVLWLPTLPASRQHRTETGPRACSREGLSLAAVLGSILTPPCLPPAVGKEAPGSVDDLGTD